VHAAVDGVRGSVKRREERAEARVSPAAAVLLAAHAVLLPCVAGCWAFSRLTKTLSHRQHALVGHVGPAVLVAVGAVLTIVTGSSAWGDVSRATDACLVRSIPCRVRVRRE
jgi:hypothetical protein